MGDGGWGIGDSRCIFDVSLGMDGVGDGVDVCEMSASASALQHRGCADGS